MIRPSRPRMRPWVRWVPIHPVPRLVRYQHTVSPTKNTRRPFLLPPSKSPGRLKTAPPSSTPSPTPLCLRRARTRHTRCNPTLHPPTRPAPFPPSTPTAQPPRYCPVIIRIACEPIPEPRQPPDHNLESTPVVVRPHYKPVSRRATTPTAIAPIEHPRFRPMGRQ